MSETTCITGLHRGEAGAFHYIFTLFHARLCFFANGILPPSIETTADDVVQEAFVKLWEKRTRFQDLEGVRAFLYLAVKNASFNVLKHEKVIARHRGENAVLPEHPVVMQRLLQAEVTEQVRQALARLPEGCRDVLQLSYFEGLRNEDAARVLQVSVNTVKSQKQRGMRLLRDMIKEPYWRVLVLVLVKCFF